MLQRVFLLSVVIAPLCLALNITNSTQDAYLIRHLLPDETCVIRTDPLGNWDQCRPSPPFPFKVLRRPVGFDATRLHNIMQVRDYISKECYERLLRTVCIMVVNVCTNDEKSIVSYLSKAECIENMMCIPNEVKTQEFRAELCATLAQDITETIIQGPKFDVFPKTITSGVMSMLSHVVLELVGIPLFVAIMLLRN